MASERDAGANDARVRVRRQLARVVEVVARRRERRLVHARPPLLAGRDVTDSARDGVRRACVEIKFRAPHAIDAIFSP